MKKISVVTGTRAEYGLLKPLIKLLNDDSDFDLQLMATAMHLSPEYGMTINEIINDGFPIVKKIECLNDTDSAVGISKSISVALSSFALAFEEIKPELIIILGDRTEMLAVAIAASIANIPIAHIHGGETTEGAYDEGIRHAITKMSYYHFTSTEDYQNRVIQLGENPSRVFNVGAIGLDSIKTLPLLSKEEFEKSINFNLGKKCALITYHPVTLEEATAANQFKSILTCLDSIPDLRMIFTHANSDRDGKIINQMIKEYVNQNNEKAAEFKSLGQLRYLSALQYIDVVVGNSSSGVIEVPYFNIPTINIGDRQKGRVAPESVLNCMPKEKDILNSLKKALSLDFQEAIQNQNQLYGTGNASLKIMNVLKKDDVVNLKKSFFDINFKL
ncbi:MAG: UDP-N-acetylglucosamine 2-epimerase (hydrolyzing) [Flavobacteriales bacterium]|nr:UDP-N-acetylglucosamine 2-epimerase (hydrolyzing) [Flavobacteriales bacterium]